MDSDEAMLLGLELRVGLVVGLRAGRSTGEGG